MNKKPYLACLLALAAGAAVLLQSCGGSDSPDNPMLPGPNGVPAVLVSSPSAVVNGAPGSYYITPDRREFHLRCPGGSCNKSTVLPLAPATGAFVWTLSGTTERPTLSPSIHPLARLAARRRLRRVNRGERRRRQAFRSDAADERNSQPAQAPGGDPLPWSA
jgi:hypothetical protein